MADDKFDAERQRREAAVQFARANVELEGFQVTPEEEAHCQRFINGEIDLAEFVEGCRRQCCSVAQADMADTSMQRFMDEALADVDGWTE